MRKELILLTLGLFVLFSFVQLQFLSYYNVFGIPFGKVDVDVYMQAIEDGEFSPDHILITVVPRLLSGIIDPALLYTVSIPFLACIILPLTLFIFAYYFSRDVAVSVISVIFMLFGTFTLQVYLISALWAQMLATIFAMWSILFIEHYSRNRRVVVLGLVAFSAMLTILSHPAGFAMVFIYLIFKLYDVVMNKSIFVFVLLFVASAGFYIINTVTNMFGNYLFSVSATYVFNSFAMPMVWILAVFSIYVHIFKNTENRHLCFMVVFIALVSPTFILWRPMVSILPMISYFAALMFITFVKKYKDFGLVRFLTPVSGVLILILILLYTMGITNSFMNAMLWEMETEPGITDVLPRSINSTIVRDMYFGGKHKCIVAKDSNGNILSERCY